MSVLVAYEVERTGTEMQIALSGTDHSYVLSCFGECDTTCETAQTATYYNSIEFHLV